MNKHSSTPFSKLAPQHQAALAAAIAINLYNTITLGHSTRRACKAIQSFSMSLTGQALTRRTLQGAVYNTAVYANLHASYGRKTSRHMSVFYHLLMHYNVQPEAGAEDSASYDSNSTQSKSNKQESSSESSGSWADPKAASESSTDDEAESEQASDESEQESDESEQESEDDEPGQETAPSDTARDMASTLNRPVSSWNAWWPWMSQTDSSE